MLKSKLQIFFDGECIVCSHEVNQYIKHDTDNLFEAIDIRHPQFDAQKYGLDPKRVQIELHVLAMGDSQPKVGIDAFREIWLRTRYLGFMATVINLPLIRPLADFGYIVFANYIRPRLPKKKCHDGSCEL